MRLKPAVLWFTLATILVLSVSASQAAEESMRAVRTNHPPKIDGLIEPLWAEADSVTEFVQTQPNEGEPLTEKTVARLLYDDQNLYIAYQCYDSEPEKLVLRIGPKGEMSGDQLHFYFDTFDSKVSAYEFAVNAAGMGEDYYAFGGGAFHDEDWDGVWYWATKMTDYGYAVEVKIPFKTLRYKQGLTEWGIGFHRWIERKEEQAYWPAQRDEDFRISRLGRLKGIQPGESGLHLELYPVALTRYDRPSLSPDAGLDLSWYPTTSSSFHLTIAPDFAQVEADPYQVNLSRYETSFSERRPFFVEDSELFRCLGGITPFYSRRIGRRLTGGAEVPILSGAKFISRPGKFQIGILSALTDEAEDGEGKVEPPSAYSAFRVKRSFFESSELGLFYAGREGEGHNRVVVADGAVRAENLGLDFAAAQTDKSGKKSDFGCKISPYWTSSGFRAEGYFQYMGENFDVSEIGYFPWVGNREVKIEGGPIFYNLGPFRRMSFALSGWWQKEFQHPRHEYSTSCEWGGDFANRWGCYLYSLAERSYEAGNYFGFLSTNLNIWSDGTKPISGNLSLRYDTQMYNYRLKYLAPYVGGNFNLTWRVNPALRLGFSLNNTTEFKPDKSVEKVSWISHPTLGWAPRKDVYLSIWSEPNTHTDIHRLNVLLSWNFMPKSWAYLAFNESRDNTTGNWKLQDRIIVAKVKYLFLI